MVPLLLLLLALAPFQEGQERKPVPKDSIEVVVVGCLSGRVLAVSEIRQPGVERGPVLRERSMRLAGKREVMDIVKAENHRIVEVVGLMKKSDVAEPGVKVGGVTISGGAPVAGARGASSLAVAYIPVLDVSAITPRMAACGNK